MPDSMPALINVKEPEYQSLVRQLNFIFKDIYRWVDYMRGIRNNTFEPVTLGEHNHQSDDAGGDYPWADIVASDVTYLQALRAAILVSNLLDKAANEAISGNWEFTSGYVQIGVIDDTYGQVHVYGQGGVSTQGGSLYLYTGANHDDTIDYFWLAVSADDLKMGPSTQTDAFMYDGGNNRWIFKKPVELNDQSASTLLSLNASKIIESLAKGTHIADASTSHAVSDWATTNAALDALGTKINSILSALETAGILNSS